MSIENLGGDAGRQRLNRALPPLPGRKRGSEAVVPNPSLKLLDQVLGLVEGLKAEGEDPDQECPGCPRGHT